MITLDFETRSKLDLKKAGPWRYSLDESTVPLCLQWAVDDQAVQLWVPDRPAIPADLKMNVHYGTLFEAHNAFFERAIWRNVMVVRYGWPDIPDEQWRCSAAKAAALALPRSLEKAGEVLDLPIKKSLEGHRLMLKMCRPRKPTKHNPAVWHEKPEDLQKLYEYCKDDVRAERCLSHAIRDLNPKEQKVWFLDQKINMRGVRIDLPAVKAAIKSCDRIKAINNAALDKLTNGHVVSTGQVQRLRHWLDVVEGFPMPSLDKAAIEWALEQPITHRARTALELRQASSKTSTAKFQAMLNGVCDGDRLHDMFMFCGAGTARWAGKRVQLQNLPRSSFDEDIELYFDVLKNGGLDLCYLNPADTLSKSIRGFFIPREGTQFYGGDYKSIEARVGAWLAYDLRQLERFRRGEDIYIALARLIYNVSEVTPEQRQVGKTGELGLIYGMGWKRFQTACWDQGGVKITEEFARFVVNTYRREHWEIVDFWKVQNAAAIHAVQSGKLVTTKYHGIKWMKKGKFLFCRLPSGRLLSYPFPKVEPHETPWGEIKPSLTYMSVNSVTRQWEKTYTHGGKIMENIDSAVARDILAEAMLRCDAAGYEVVLHAHDEILSESDGGSTSQFADLMSERPKWGLDIPIEAEPWSGMRYAK